MSFHYLNNVSLEQAKKDYLELLIKNGFRPRTERIPVRFSCGRVTAGAVYAHINAPHYVASAMDGIALAAKDSFGASETMPVVLKADQFSFVDTGDPIPEHCDAVIMVEDIVNHDDGSVSIYAATAPWKNIRQIGEDICAGEMILSGGMKITPSAVGAMIAGGVEEIEVIQKPVIGIIPTGDEIIAPCANPRPGDILEFNSSIFSTMITQWGGCPKTYPIVPDKFDSMRKAAEQAADECDMVLLNAGSSSGREDYSFDVICAIGEVLYHGIAMKPGKPAILGCRESVPVLGVPGYPVSGIIVIEELLRPLIEYWFMNSEEMKHYTEAVLTRRVVSGLKYQEFVRVRMGYVGGRLMASPLARGSGIVSSFMKADGILEVPQGSEGYETGEIVRVRLLNDQAHLEHTLVVIGSHDPLLDELADMLHTADSRLFMSSSHVGSMGGIMALLRGEAHAAGCHLLDTRTGEYNKSFIRQYFPNGGVKLVRCVGRQQGLMLQKGNPLGITCITDLAGKGIRYVNRQKGSGTRILMDYLCRENGVEAEKIYGYDREELTHNSVAVQIAGDTADVGMGIYSAAKLYGLDFLPICVEEYDILIPDKEWETPMVQKLIEMLKSDVFKERILAMGGYTIDAPGEMIPID